MDKGRVVATALLAAGAGSARATARGDVSVLALIPTPGYPALPHVLGNLIYEVTYENPAGDSVPSRVLEYTADGTLTHSWTVQGQDLSKPHGVQVAANDAQGRLLLLDKTSGRIIRLDPRSGAHSARYTGTNNSSVPFDSPSGVAFAGTRQIIANQSYSAGSKANQALLTLETGEPGATVYVPADATSSKPPARRKHKHRHHKRRHHRRRHRHR
ncbi:MAG TPA: hypothetical protein VLC49_13535 [Solirubrobacteraceae bacterium]|nr:hypothetical protein [Solirubrobacteraceae bacterium]